jgi:nicotinamide-nucleotide amidase
VAGRLSRPRGAILVTGSELVRGDRADKNGPYLAQSLLSLGIDPVEVRIVGDAPAELERALKSGLEHELLVVSGGLGPTHDDRTVELLARAAGRPLVLHEALENRIATWTRQVALRLRRPYKEFAAGVHKQASVPDGAVVAGLAGTAPALVLELPGCVAVTLPGPPRELQALWPVVVQTEPLQRLLARATPSERRILRLYGVSESAVAAALAEAGGDGEGVEVTICARDFEIHVDLVVDPGAEERADTLEKALVAPLEQFVFAHDAAPIEQLVLSLCRVRGLTLATAESCTGGLVAARLTSVPGSSDVFVGGVVAYANEVKASALGVPAEVLAAHGAVSAETAAAMAQGARARLGADLAVAVTGIAGPAGGSAEKPVGLVHLHIAGPDGERAVDFTSPGDRETVRARSAVAALHLIHSFVTNT